MYKFYGPHDYLNIKHPNIVADLSKVDLGNYVIPLKEEVVLKVAKFNDNLEQIVRFVDRIQLRSLIPSQYNLDWQPLPEECVLKNNTSTFSDGVKIVSRLTATNDLAKIAKKYGIQPRLMVEEKIPGPQYEISGWVSSFGIFFLPMLTQHWVGNRIVKYEPVSNAKIEQDHKTMIRKIDQMHLLPDTPFCVETRYKNGTPRIIDFNLRLGEEKPNKGYYDLNKVNSQMIGSYNGDFSENG